MRLEKLPERFCVKVNRLADRLAGNESIAELLRQGIVIYQRQQTQAGEAGFHSSFAVEVSGCISSKVNPLQAVWQTKSQQIGKPLSEAGKTTVMVNTAIGGGLELISRAILRLPGTERFKPAIQQRAVTLYKFFDWDDDPSVLGKQKQGEYQLSSGDRDRADGIVGIFEQAVNDGEKTIPEIMNDCERLISAADAAGLSRDVAIYRLVQRLLANRIAFGRKR